MIEIIIQRDGKYVAVKATEEDLLKDEQYAFLIIKEAIKSLNK